MRVLRQQGTVQVGAEDVARGHPLEAVFAVVARAPQNPAERPEAGAKIGLAAVVFEAHQGRRGQPQVAGLDHDVADVAARSRYGVQVDQPQSRQFLAVGGHVVLTQELVPSADRQHHGPAVDRLADRRPFVLAAARTTSSWSRSWPPPQKIKSMPDMSGAGPRPMASTLTGIPRHSARFVRVRMLPRSP